MKQMTVLALHPPSGVRQILLPKTGVRFDDEIRQMEIALLQAAINRSEGNKAAAARLLQLDSQRMKYLCRKYSL